MWRLSLAHRSAGATWRGVVVGGRAEDKYRRGHNGCLYACQHQAAPCQITQTRLPLFAPTSPSGRRRARRTPGGGKTPLLSPPAFRGRICCGSTWLLLNSSGISALTRIYAAPQYIGRRGAIIPALHSATCRAFTPAPFGQRKAREEDHHGVQHSPSTSNKRTFYLPLHASGILHP